MAVVVKSLLGAVAVVFCLAMMSGHMHNSIENPPFIIWRKGRAVYFYPSSKQQLLAESYLAMFLSEFPLQTHRICQFCITKHPPGAMVALGMILLIESKALRRSRQMATTGLGLFLVFFYFMTSAVKAKGFDYPYSFGLE
ncbi:hypothetical protein KR018_002066 [Drosophila ironensis]|nr:hypothetical protein KR018_002066 [Drosophila ironensis]